MKLYYPHKINDFHIMLGKDDLVGFFSDDGLFINQSTAKDNVITALLWRDIKKLWLENKDRGAIIENHWLNEIKKYAAEMALISFGGERTVQNEDTDNSDLGEDFADLVDYGNNTQESTVPTTHTIATLPIPTKVAKIYKIIDLCLPFYSFDMNGTPIFPSHLLPSLAKEFDIKLKDVIIFTGVFILNFKL